VFAPIASASDETAMIVNPRLLRSTRAANTRSNPIPGMRTRLYPKMCGAVRRRAPAGAGERPPSADQRADFAARRVRMSCSIGHRLVFEDRLEFPWVVLGAALHRA